MKRVTSVTLHTTSEGQRISYTYSVVNENTGALLSENNRESMIVLDIPNNTEVLSNINSIIQYVSNKLGD